MTHNPDRRIALLGLAVAAGTAALGSKSAKAAQASARIDAPGSGDIEGTPRKA